MKALVTGGSGFIGSHVVDKLVQRGIDVRIFDMIEPASSVAEYYRGSLLDYESLRMAILGMDVVLHLAAVADVADVVADPQYAESINVRGTINVLEAARRHKTGRVVYGSTTWVYGAAPASQVDESAALAAPEHLYTATKLASEHYCRCYGKQYGVPVTILRYGIPYGPRARDSAVLPLFVGKVLAGEPITIAGDGSQFRQFVYVEDLAEGNVLALKAVAANRVYNLDGTERITIRQLAETVVRLLGRGEIIYGPVRPGDFSGHAVISARARDELGWTPRVTFEAGVRRYIDWYLEREKGRRAAWDALDVGLRA